MKKKRIKIDFLSDWNRLRSIFSCDSIFTWYCCVCAPIHNSKGRTNKKNLTQLNLIGKLVFCYRKNSFQWKHLANEQILLTPFDFCSFFCFFYFLCSKSKRKRENANYWILSVKHLLHLCFLFFSYHLFAHEICRTLRSARGCNVIWLVLQ